MKRAVFLDRDGVLNEPVVRDGQPYPPASPEEVIVCDGAPAALHELRALGFALVCVTNQPDVARGTTNRALVDAINARLMDALPLDAVFVCPHDEADDCECRKPKPGLIFQAATQLDLDVRGSYLVGDRWRDIEAGAAAKCRTLLVDRGYRERASSVAPNASVPDITAAAAWIIADAGGRS
jgi:D-glycero-D-manno-heptose 1,7-bisphosphate phosphatase